MVGNASTEGVFIACDILMAQLIIHMNDLKAPSEKFIVRVLDEKHLFVLPDAAGMIRKAISKSRKQNSFQRPS
ncbi:unnamed protein product [Linum tenue]|uniref:General transcription and DNA repair factor IIH subunit TFB5 n=1 Tax=Linum tenue TaxID=586396 RepID=A0AAV0JYI0_9ROSI|nr:unnamed protein product [Linum tenue]